MPRLSQKETGILTRLMTRSEIETVIKELPSNESSGQDSFTGEFYLTHKEERISILLKLLQKTEEEGILPNLLYEATITLIPISDKDTNKKRKLWASIFDEDRWQNSQ